MIKFLKRARTSALLSILFLVVYGSCNWLSSIRSDVSMFYFEWERHIPFVPWMIIPYMSIDLFFVAAPFLCTDDDELKILSRRIIFVILAAGAFFLLFPLRFAFDRPPATGWPAPIFEAFRGMDKPFNLAPSLHIALRTILAAIYVRHTRGVLRTAVHIWFVLIGFSTVLTYQHHLIDVLTGFILAAYCFFLFPDPMLSLSLIPNRRVGIYYVAGALLLLVIAWRIRSWALILLWPSASMAIVASAYLHRGPGIYQKRAGRLPLWSHLVLAPILLGQRLSLGHYRRQCRAWDDVAPGVWIGRKLSDVEATEAVKRGTTAVLDLTAEFDEARPFLNVAYLNIPILDLTAPTQQQLNQMAEFIQEYAVSGIVYVHCKIGYSRSAAAVGAYLLKNGPATTVGDVVTRLRTVRPSIIVRPEVMNALTTFQESCKSGFKAREVSM
jgi:protein-tyrosine phosphatase/membrane-associated phospholipid phosphatase